MLIAVFGWFFVDYGAEFSNEGFDGGFY